MKSAPSIKIRCDSPVLGSLGTCKKNRDGIEVYHNSNWGIVGCIFSKGNILLIRLQKVPFCRQC